MEWLGVGHSEDLVHLELADALLGGYEEVRSFSAAERQAAGRAVAAGALRVSLSETDYFLSILGSEEKARLGYEGYFLGHAAWFESGAGLRLLEQMQGWADGGRVACMLGTGSGDVACCACGSLAERALV